MNVNQHAKISVAAVDLIECSAVAYHAYDQHQKAYSARKAEDALRKIADALGFDLTRRVETEDGATVDADASLARREFAPSVGATL